MHAPLAELPISPEDVTTLSRWAQDPLTSKLLVIAGPGELPTLAATALARQVLAAHGGDDQDLRIHRPTKDRWTVDELAGALTDARLRPQVANLIILARADALSSGAATQLLRVTEEPTARTVFILAVSDLGTLSSPLLGRTAHTHQLTGLPPTAVADKLHAHGWAPEDAAAAVSMFAPHPDLALLLVSHGRDALDTAAPLLDRIPGGTAPTSEALAATDAASATASLLASELRTADERRSATAAHTRDLLRLAITRWRDQVRRGLRQPDLTAGKLQMLEQAARALDHADAAVNLYVPPASVLCTLFNRWPTGATSQVPSP